MQPDIVATLMGNVMQLFLMIKSFTSKFKKKKTGQTLNLCTFLQIWLQLIVYLRQSHCYSFILTSTTIMDTGNIMCICITHTHNMFIPIARTPLITFLRDL